MQFLKEELQMKRTNPTKLFNSYETIGKYRVTYNWSEDSMLFESSIFIADLPYNRISAFGSHLRYDVLTEEYIDTVLQFIYEYECEYMDSPEAIKRRGVKKLK